MRRLLPLLLLVLPLLPARAEAITVRDVIELSRAGLGEDVLLALIEVDRTIFAIDAATIKSLKAAGVSERVIMAMIRSGRTEPPPAPEPVIVNDPPPPPDPPQVIVIDHRDPPEIREIAVPVPIFVPVWPSRRVHSPFDPSFPVRVILPSGTRFIPSTGLSAPPPPPSTDVFAGRRRR